VRFVFFSDLHFGAPFGWDGPPLVDQRQAALRKVLENILGVADEVRADAVLCGGDLYVSALADSDTGEFLRNAFASISPLPVFIAPGNHDCFGPQSLYQSVRWSSNVHIFSQGSLQPFELEPGLTLWGAAHRARSGTAGFLDAFEVVGGGVHIALLHGSEARGMSHEESGDTNAPFFEEQIPACGLDHAFVGHYHEHRDGEHHTYSGNPDPLTLAEIHEPDSGSRGPVVVDVNADGSIERKRQRVATTQIHDLTLDIARARTVGEVKAIVESALEGLSGIAQVTIEGDPDVPSGSVDFGELVTTLEGLHVRSSP